MARSHEIVSGAFIAATPKCRRDDARWMALWPVYECDGQPDGPSQRISERDSRVPVRCYPGGPWPERTSGDRVRQARDLRKPFRRCNRPGAWGR